MPPGEQAFATYVAHQRRHDARAQGRGHGLCLAPRPGTPPLVLPTTNAAAHP